ncbi:tetratricopeptide repeat protein [Syntrophobotulus glycolicus]|uniref:tetratricopeptide repeat protein n=1 Tax=Syntrophobotulus glycolicus TaxID=51197 RepID=UPI00145C69AE|nr:hypothetical protein [Syntrophobotulus glycolicus]
MGGVAMDSKIYVDSFSTFAEFAGSDYSLWEKLIGCEIRHRTFGIGIIEKISGTTLKDSVLIKIRFIHLPESERIKIFSNISFAEGYFGNINVDFALFPGFQEFCEMRNRKEQDCLTKKVIEAEEQKKEQALQEAKFLEEFNVLKQEYGLDELCFHPNLYHLLYTILLKLKAEENLDEEDLLWLNRNNLFKVLAIYYESEYLKSGNLWSLVKASENWRRLANAARAIELLKDKCSNDSKLMSTILTTCGAAFQDINESTEAEKYARKAIKASRYHYYPYHLLGVIYFHRGRPEKGDKYFAKAMELGLNPKVMEDEIEKVFETAGKDVKVCIAKYLFNKDRQKYQWAKHYSR